MIYNKAFLKRLVKKIEHIAWKPAGLDSDRKRKLGGLLNYLKNGNRIG